MGLALCLLLLCGGTGSGCSWLGIQSNPNAESQVLSAKQTAEVELAMARTAEQQEQWPTALRIYRQVLDVEPKHPVATHRLAILYSRQGDFEQSSQWFEKALKLTPDNPELFCDIGFSLYVQERYREAEVNFRKAIAIDPEQDRAQNHLGMVLAHLGNHEEAFAAFRQANCTPAQAHSNIAVILALNGRPMEARQHLEYATSVGPDDRGILDRRAGLESLIVSRQPSRPASPQYNSALSPVVYVSDIHQPPADNDSQTLR